MLNGPPQCMGGTQTLTCAAIAGVLVCDKSDDDRLEPFWRSLEDPFKESESTKTATFESRLADLNRIAQDTGKLAADNYWNDNFQDLAQRALHAARVADE